MTGVILHCELFVGRTESRMCDSMNYLKVNKYRRISQFFSSRDMNSNTFDDTYDAWRLQTPDLRIPYEAPLEAWQQ